MDFTTGKEILVGFWKWFMFLIFFDQKVSFWMDENFPATEILSPFCRNSSIHISCFGNINCPVNLVILYGSLSSFRISYPVAKMIKYRHALALPARWRCSKNHDDVTDWTPDGVLGRNMGLFSVQKYYQNILRYNATSEAKQMQGNFFPPSHVHVACRMSHVENCTFRTRSIFPSPCHINVKITKHLRVADRKLTTKTKSRDFLSGRIPHICTVHFS